VTALKGSLQRTPHSLPRDQAQRDRQEVREDNPDPGLVRARRREAVPAAVQGFDTQWYRNILQKPRYGLMRGEQKGNFGPRR